MSYYRLRQRLRMTYLSCSVNVLLLTLNGVDFLYAYNSFQFLPRNHQGNAFRFTPSPQRRSTLTLHISNTTFHESDNIASINTNNSSATKKSVIDIHGVDENRKTIESLNNKSSHASLLGYFPFLRSSQSITIDSQNDSSVNMSTGNSSVTSILLNKKASETLTVADFDKIVSQIQPPLHKLTGRKYTASSIRSTTDTSTSSLVSSDRQRSNIIEDSKKSVAFPQPSILSEHDIQRGTTVAGSLSGLILGTTILPNLWLLGMIFGAFYGYEITKKSPLSVTQVGQIPIKEPNGVARFLISFGKQLAKICLQLTDYGETIWFLYKTGQLSYEYYKTYETLDTKFAIQNKVDAWNLIFVEGKDKFDAWEQENEVGRKMLAGLRTAWLVDEQSRQRATGRSRYRLVQIAYDVKNSISRLLQNTFLWTQSLFLPGVINSFFKGLRIELEKESSLVTRLGSMATILVAVNIGGAVFSISAPLCMIMAALLAFVYPSWANDFVSRMNEVGLDILSKGRKNDKSRNLSRTSIYNFDLLAIIQQRWEEQGHRSNGNTRKSSSFSNKKGGKGPNSKRSRNLSSFFDSNRQPKKKRR